MTTSAPTGRAPVKGDPGFVPMFPPYLEKGSRGPAVHRLQMELVDAECANGLTFTEGVFDDDVELAVKRRQRQTGWRHPKKVDGRWGPATRDRHVQFGGGDVDVIPYDPAAGKTIWVHEGVNQGEWPPEPMPESHDTAPHADGREGG